MRARWALFVGLLGGQAAAETDPLTVEGIAWDNCLTLLDEMIVAHQTAGASLMDAIEDSGRRSAALISEDEIIVLNCARDGRPATFTLRASPL
ncbi:hypothetical protein AADZ90_004180 [Aestuariibius sp. 2305UL40-4]|uniref:hypothetical protein n=1 Tax=Aestuariibius violaceus TaxID=3234132 RepID=UPI00345F0EE7